MFKGKVKAYNTQVDLWSAGVLLFVMLEGAIPFACDKIAKWDYSIDPKGSLPRCSPDVKDLIFKGLLVIDPAKRFDVDKALDHPWIDDKHEILGRLFRKMLEKFAYKIQAE